MHDNPQQTTASPPADPKAAHAAEPAGLPELNPVIHGKLRLAILSLLTGVDRVEFTWLRGKTGSTDGNLGAHLLKLEESGYIETEKKFVQRKPMSFYRITELGRSELAQYVRALRTLLDGAL
ncbi:MAG: winged helix-turn-helix domain-containing protein [Acidobacteriaceae bacterium]